MKSSTAEPLTDSTFPSWQTTLFASLSIILLFIMTWLSFDFGVTWDEWMQATYGKLIWRFLLSGGQNQDFMRFGETLHLYGGFFDSITAFIYGNVFESFPEFLARHRHASVKELSTQDIAGSGYWETRHFVNSLFGFIAAFYAARIAKKIDGPIAGCLVMILLALSPHFLGHSMNNPKDIPFAATYVFSLFYMIRFIDELPNPRTLTGVMLAIGFGAAISMRIGGILLIMYFGLFGGLYWLYTKLDSQRQAAFVKTVTWGIAISIGGYLLGMIFWPYGMMNPIKNPLNALSAMSNFSGAEGKVLFEGQILLTSQLPWYYLPKWISMTTPLFFHTGLILFLLQIKSFINRHEGRFIFMILFVSLFPVFFVISKGSVLYDGWRHFIFIYPPLMILAGLGWWRIILRTRENWQRYIVVGGLAIIVLQPLTWMIRNHPNQSSYFNALVGGIDKAWKNYPTDYWGNCMKESAEWLADYHMQNYPGQSAIIGTNALMMSQFPYLKRKMGKLYIPYIRMPEDLKGKVQPHYVISLPLKLAREDIERGAWPPAGTLHTINVDNAPVCAIVKQR